MKEKEPKEKVKKEIFEDGKTLSFVTSTKKLLKALEFVKKNIHVGGSTMPVLNCVLFTVGKEIISIRRTDLEIDLSTDIEVSSIKGDIEQFLLEADLLHRIVKNASAETIEFDMTRKVTRIIDGFNNYDIASGPNPKEFPSFQSHKDYFVLSLPSKTFQKMLQDAILFTSQDTATKSTRPVFTGVCLEMIKGKDSFGVTATNGNVLYHNESPLGLESPIDCEIIIPKAFIDAIGSLQVGDDPIDVHVLKDESVTTKTRIIGLWINHSGYYIKGRLIDDKFPKWRYIIPSSASCSIEVSRPDLLSVSKKVIDLCEDAYPGIEMKLNDTEIIMVHKNKLLLQEFKFHLDANIEGAMEDLITKNEEPKKQNKIKFNGNFLYDMTKTFDKGKVYISISSYNRAGIFTSEKTFNSSLPFILIMPILQ